jgi:exonuclease VII large subunit
VHTLREGEPSVLRAKRRELCETDTTTVSLPSGEATSDTLSEALLREVGSDTPSEASNLLSESVREIREKTEMLREELGLLEGRLEMMEITESTLREGLQQEKERADRERERADRLRDELEAERTRRRGEPREFWRRLFG